MHIHAKKDLPAPTLYESRGKSMFELLKDKARADKPMNADDLMRISGKVKKTSVAGPGTYKVEEALAWSASMRSSI